MVNITVFGEDVHHFVEAPVSCILEGISAGSKEQPMESIFGHDVKDINVSLDRVQTGDRSYTLQLGSLPMYDIDCEEDYFRVTKHGTMSGDESLAPPKYDSKISMA